MARKSRNQGSADESPALEATTNSTTEIATTPGRETPAQGEPIAEPRFMFTWEEHGLPTGHDHAGVAFAALNRGCVVLKDGQPWQPTA